MPNEKTGIKPAVLLIMDGWGVAPATAGNAITGAKTPNINRYLANYPAMTLAAASIEVGQNWGEMGNSEVGHLNIGAGRVYYQSMPRINKAISDGSFSKNPVFLSAFEHVKTNESKLHLIGLVSSGGVHSHMEHLWKIVEMCDQNNVSNVFVHCILDGRDTLMNSGVDFINQTAAVLKKYKVGKIASLIGRYYAMDRDNRWDRVEKAYRLMTAGAGMLAKDPIEAIRDSYEKKVFDEEFEPMAIVGSGGKPLATIAKNDAVIFFNFREDRARELTQAFVLPDFKGFAREIIENLYFVTMTEYEKGLPTHVAFEPDIVNDCLAKVVSDAGLRQLHAAETEKYAHVTFFINGQREAPFLNEDRILVPSPRISSYDLQPEMSAYEVTNNVVRAIQNENYDLIIVNLANPDMVGHTGNLEATIKAVEVTDECAGKIVDATLARGGAVFITADHGNAEEVRNLQTGGMDKEHSTNAVPFIVVAKSFEGQTFGLDGAGADLSLVPPVGVLGDVAPTILKVMGLPQPDEMTGRPLV